MHIFWTVFSTFLPQNWFRGMIKAVCKNKRDINDPINVSERASLLCASTKIVPDWMMYV